MKTVSKKGVFQCVGALSWGEDSPAAENLSLPLMLLLELVVQEALLLVDHVDHKGRHPVAVAKFIVIPRNEFDKALAESNANPKL